MARYSNYSFSTGAQFDPMTFQEILTPYVMYKEEFDKAETAYNELSTNADKYKYLGEQLEGTDSKAAKIYKGYADELNKQANDFAKHGLNILNRRGLTNLKRRYSGEIGRLDLANTAMEKERELRRTLNAKDSSMLYAQDNLNIDDFLDNATPNLYNISGTELYTRGAAAGKSAASRVYSAGDAGSTLNGYYRDWVERNGYSKESMDAFRANVSAIPELQQAADAILQERGVLDNLTGNNLARARQAVLNGIIDGAVYAEKHSPVRDEGRLSAAQSSSLAMERERLNLSAASSGMRKVGGQWVYDSTADPSVNKAVAVAAAKGGAGGGSRGTAYDVRNKATVVIGSKTGKMKKYDSDDDGDFEYARALTEAELTGLIDASGNATNEYLRSAIGNGSISDYEIYIIPKGSDSGWFSSGTKEDQYIVIPRESKRAATDDPYGGGASVGGTNDIPQ